MENKKQTSQLESKCLRQYRDLLSSLKELSNLNNKSVNTNFEDVILMKHHSQGCRDVVKVEGLLR